MKVSVKVKNSGQRAGDEVVQLYLHPLEPARDRANKELRGFQRVTLQPGEERTVDFTLVPEKDLRTWDEQAGAYVVDPGRYEVQVGASSADIRVRAPLSIRPKK